MGMKSDIGCVILGILFNFYIYKIRLIFLISRVVCMVQSLVAIIVNIITTVTTSNVPQELPEIRPSPCSEGAFTSLEVEDREALIIPQDSMN